MLSQNMGLYCTVRENWGLVIFIPKRCVQVPVVRISEKGEQWFGVLSKHNKANRKALLKQKHSLLLPPCLEKLGCQWEEQMIWTMTFLKGKTKCFIASFVWDENSGRESGTLQIEKFLSGQGLILNEVIWFSFFYSCGKNNLECMIWRQLLSNFTYITECLISNSEEPKCIYLLQI